MRLTSLFDLFFANINGDDLATETREDLSIRARNVVRLLAARKEPLIDIRSDLAELLAAWHRPTVHAHVSGADVDWLDDGRREALLKELLQEIHSELKRLESPLQ